MTEVHTSHGGIFSKGRCIRAECGNVFCGTMRFSIWQLIIDENLPRKFVILVLILVLCLRNMHIEMTEIALSEFCENLFATKDSITINFKG